MDIHSLTHAPRVRLIQQAQTPSPTLAATEPATSSVEPLSVPTNDGGAAAGAKDTTDVTTTPEAQQEAPASSSSSGSGSSLPQQQLPSAFEPPFDSSSGGGPVSNAPQTIDAVVTYAGDAGKVGALEQALLAMVKPYGTYMEASTHDLPCDWAPVSAHVMSPSQHYQPPPRLPVLAIYRCRRGSLHSLMSHS